MSFLDKVLPKGYVACLLRKHIEPSHPECGFMCFDTNHKINPLFMYLYLNTYTTGAFQCLRTQCDSSVFDLVQKQLMPPTVNLTKVVDDPMESYEIGKRPFEHSILDEYMVHLKGLKKKDVYNSRRT